MLDSKFTLNLQIFLWGFEKDDYDYLNEDSKELTSIKNEIEEAFNYSKIIRSENDHPTYKLLIPSDEEIKNEGEVIYIFHSWIPLSNNSDDATNNIKEFICKLSEKQETLVRGFILPKEIEEIETIESVDWDSFILKNKTQYFTFRNGSVD
jgi:hypothetical protein